MNNLVRFQVKTIICIDIHNILLFVLQLFFVFMSLNNLDMSVRDHYNYHTNNNMLTLLEN